MSSTTRSLIAAAAAADADVIRSLLAEGANVNETNERGQTPLMLAALFGRQEIVGVLLDAGADPGLRDGLGLTANEWSIRRGFPDIAALIAKSSPAAARKKTAEQKTSVEAEHFAEERPAAPVETETERSSATINGKERQNVGLGAAAYAMLKRRAAQAQAESQKLQAQAAEVEMQKGKAPDEVIPAPEHELIEDSQEKTEASTVSEVQAAAHDNVAPVAITEQQQPHEPNESNVEHQTVLAEASDSVAPPNDESRLYIPSLSNEDAASDDPLHITFEPAAEAWTAPADPLEIPPIDAGEDHFTLPDASPLSIGPETHEFAAEPADIAPAWQQMASDISEEPTLAPPESDEETLPRMDPVVLDSLTIGQGSYEIGRAPSSVRVPTFEYGARRHPASIPMVWLLVALTLGGSAFITYRLTNRHAKQETPPPAPAAVTEQPVVKKNLPVVSGELAGAAFDVPEAEYPAAAASSREAPSGAVDVQVRVNKKGKVTSAHAVSGDYRLRMAAINAAVKAKFSPEKLSDNRGGVTGTITYNFTSPPSNTSSTVPKPTPVAKQSPSPIEPAPVEEAKTKGNRPVAGGPLAGTEVNLPDAEYPEGSKRKGVDGTIAVTVRVNRAGKVISWLTGTGDAQLRAAALKAAKKSTFSPSKLPGKGEVVGTITYNFKR